MRLFKTLFILGFLGLILWGCGGGSGGGTSFTPSGGIIAVAEQIGSNVKIKVGGTKGAAPAGSTVTVTDLNTGVMKPPTTARADGSFDPTFTGSTSDMFRVVVSDNGTTITDKTIGVTVISEAVKRDLAQLGNFPTQIEIHGNRAYVVNGGSDNIQIFDLDKDPSQKVGTIVLPLSSNPNAIAFLNDTEAYVSNFTGQSVALVNVQTMQCELLIVRSDHVPPNPSICQNNVILAGPGSFEDPSGIAVSTGKVYVTNSNLDKSFKPAGNGFVTVIDTTKNRVTKTIQLSAENAAGITVVGNRVYAVSSGSSSFDSNSGLVTPTSDGAVGVIDSTTDNIVNIPIPLNSALPLVGFPNKLEPTPDEKFGYIGSGTAGVLFKVNLQNNTLVRGADNPIIVTSAKKQDATFDVEIRDDGLGFIAIFNTDQIVVFDTSTDIINPFPFIFPFPAGHNPNAQIPEGIQDIAIRTDGNFPDVFFITGISQKLGSINTASILPPG
jgi:hypothetical protein